ncbi:MAG: Type secretion system protein subtype b, partial [Pseudomonadota bacterium]
MNGRFEGTWASRSLALLLALGAAALAHWALSAPLHARFEAAQDRIASHQQLLTRLAMQIRTSQPYNTQADDKFLRDAIFDGESDAIVAATLQSVLRSMGDAAGWRLSTSRNLPARETNGLRLVGIEGRFTTTTAGLQRSLAELEGTRPHVIIGAVNVVAAADSPEATREELQVRIELFG